MIGYSKIETLFDRGPATGKVIYGAWRLPEFEYLRDCPWELTEKVDGTNIRVGLEPFEESTAIPADDWHLSIAGRTDKADIPPFLVSRLLGLFSADRLKALWRGQKGCERCGGAGYYGPPGFPGDTLCACVVPYPITLYGEGYGARIQKCGGNYIKDGVDFVLFDVRVGDKWLARADVYGIADRLGIKHVPVVYVTTLAVAVALVANGVTSAWGDFQAEGVVARPTVELLDARGRRIIGKIKTKDF